MKNMKYGMTFGIMLVCTVLFTACDNFIDILEIQKPIENGYGRISISFTGDEVQLQTTRTVLPSNVFDKYVYTFTKVGETNGVVKTPGNDGLFILEVGSYTVAVQAYTGTAESYTLTASGVSQQFDVSSSITAKVFVPLSIVADLVNGEFSYTITFPAGAEAVITLQKWSDMTIALDPDDTIQGNGKTQTLELEAGSYLFTVLVSKNGFYAGLTEAVHIYPSLPTTYTKDFVDSDLLAPISPISPIVNDYTIEGIETFYYDGNPKTVTITPKEGKSNGTVTIKYNGSTIAPSAIGTYTVTFDVAAVTGFNAVSGLFAGTLTINPFTSIADLSTYLQSRPANTASNPYIVALNVNILSNDRYIINAISGKYVNLDLSGSTFTKIFEGTFYKCNFLTNITIPNSVTSIEREAFYQCNFLFSVTIPNSVTSIGDYAFCNCTNLTSVIIGNSVTSIGMLAFAGCTSLTSVIIGNSVTSIEAEAFLGCRSLASITIPNSVTYIGDFAFDGCTSLTSVTIPNSVTSISGNPFYRCTNITTINVDVSNNAYISDDGVLYNKYKSKLIIYPAGKTDRYFTIPDSVEIIENHAFSGCSNLITVIIPDSVGIIESYAFSGCSNLTSVIIPDSVTFIENGAFDGCSSLASITIPDSVTSIWYDTFSRCTSLTSVIIPNSITSIGSGAFYGCTSLTSIIIPNNVKEIRTGAFSGCINLTSVIFQGTINSSDFGSDAFGDKSVDGGYNYIGDLRAKYLSGGIGTYERASGSLTWTKQ